MKDTYPQSTIPADWLVATVDQPEYAEDANPFVDDHANIGYHLFDRQVDLGRGNGIAAIQAETGQSWTFAEMADRSTRLARQLVARGLNVGDRVAYRAPNVAEVLVVMAAIWKAGGVVVPIPAAARPDEVPHYLNDAGARFVFLHARASVDQAIFTDSGVEEVFGFADDDAMAGAAEANLPVVAADMPALLWHTGGTTGKPKGCYHTHRRYLLGGYRLGEGMGTQPGEIFTAAAPIGHALGIIHNTIFTLPHGATSLLAENYSDAGVLLNAIATHKVTTLTALMASWAKMAERIAVGGERDTSSLKRCYAMWQSASSSETFDFWMNRGVQLYNNFGSTAFATWPLMPDPSAPSARAALGRALPGYIVDAVDDDLNPMPAGEIGRLAIKGPTGLTYWRLPELQRRDVKGGYTLSDDMIRFDEAGEAHYLGRTDYMISTGGYKVAPGEIEAVLVQHPAVREVAVVASPCATLLEKVTAYIAVSEGFTGDAALVKQLQDAVRATLATYKVPRRIEFIDALPRDPVGKVQTRIIQGWANTPQE